MPCNKDSAPTSVISDARSSTSSGIIQPHEKDKTPQNPTPTKRQPPQCLVLPQGSRGPIVTHSDYDLPLSAQPSPDWLSKARHNSANTYSDPNLVKELHRKAAAKAIAVIGGCAPIPISTTPCHTGLASSNNKNGAVSNGSVGNGHPLPSQARQRHSNNNNNRYPRSPVTFAPVPSSLASNGSMGSHLGDSQVFRDGDEENIGALGASSMDYMNRMSDPASGDASNTGGGGRDDGGSDWNMKESFSAKDHHAAVQNRYSRNRQRHYTDPVDFEGILRIIGGCGWWQIWIYFLISLQQIPHAMFNLSVMYSKSTQNF